MFPALLTTFLFALSAVSGQRIAIYLGAGRGNLIRLGIATIVLGTVTLTFFSETLTASGLPWYLLSGAIGFGLGDLALFFAYERIGSRLTILLNLCLAPLFGATLEFLWKDVRLSTADLLASGVILSGVALAVFSRNPMNKAARERRGNFHYGLIAAIVAGIGQGTGAVLSNHARNMAGLSAPGSPGEAFFRGSSEAFQRVAAGFVVVAIVYMLVLKKREAVSATIIKSQSRGQVSLWLLLAAFAGPVIGVSCFQWALASVESSALVLAVVATTPIVLMPLAAIVEKDRPTAWAIFGGVIAVSGVILLQMVSRI